jgi:hypothetical protein
MSNQTIPSQKVSSDLVVELSTEEQQLLSGGHWGGGWDGCWGWGLRRRW